MQLRTFLGGHPVAVLIRLAVLSILAGLVLSFFGITPRNFFATLDDLARRIYDLGFGAIEWIFEYLVLGAMIVVPLWLISRFLRWRGIKTD
jgi:hypothetical protein